MFYVRINLVFSRSRMSCFAQFDLRGMKQSYVPLEQLFVLDRCHNCVSDKRCHKPCEIKLV